MGLAHKAAARPGALSGGERQRVAIARALVGEPDALLLDEPFTGLDALLRAEICEELGGLFAARGTTLLHVTHDPWEATQMAARLVVIDQGQVVHDGAELPPDAPSPFVRRLAALRQQRCASGPSTP